MSRPTIAVFRSWDAPKAAAYRRLRGLSDAAGTAVTVQTMVFGNAGGRSGTGVGFTRDPATGAPGLYFDFCLHGQGEDVAAGRRGVSDGRRLRRLLPPVLAELEAVGAKLEAEFRDVQDFEFTVEDGRLYLLQTRSAQRTPWAALRTALDMVAQGLIAPEEALRRLADIDLAGIARSHFAEPLPEALAQAAVAGHGVASGAVALDAVSVQRLAAKGQPVLLVRPDAVTADILGMAQVAGILTAAGSRTSHAAVVARQLGKVCLVGCEALGIDIGRRICRVGTDQIAEGAAISLDGNTGAVGAGNVSSEPAPHPAAIIGIIVAEDLSELAFFEGNEHPVDDRHGCRQQQQRPRSRGQQRGTAIAGGERDIDRIARPGERPAGDQPGRPGVRDHGGPVEQQEAEAGQRQKDG